MLHMGRIEFGSGHKDNQIIHFEDMLPLGIPIAIFEHKRHR